jgi:hypothetical protein
MAKEHIPVIRKPTDEELDQLITTAEKMYLWVIVGALLDYKQLRKAKEAGL